MVTSAPVTQVEELRATLDRLAQMLETLPAAQRSQAQGEIEKVRAYLGAPVRPAEQAAYAGFERRQNRELTGLFFDHMREPAVVYQVIRDEAGNIVDLAYREINNACLQALGIERDQIHGKTVRACFGDDYFHKNLPQVMHVLATGAAVHFEERIANSDYLASMFKVSENTLAKIGMDITERKQAEYEIGLVNDALARSEARYRTLEQKYFKAFRSSPAALAISSITSGLFYEINENHVQITGYSGEETIGHTSRELNLFVDPEERTRIIALLEQQGSLHNYEMKVRRKSGEIITVLFSAEPIELNGEACMLAATIDITERKQTELLSQTINEIDKFIHSSLDFNEIMRRTVVAGAIALECDSAAISMYKDGRWVISAVQGLPDGAVGLTMDDKQELHAQLAIQTRLPVAVDDAFNDARFNREHLRAWGIRSVLVVPVVIRDEAIGVMFFNFQRAPVQFRPAHIDFGVKVAASLSLALENARLYQNIKEEVNYRKQVESSLREREALLRESEAKESARASEVELLMDAAPAVIWVTHDPECRVMLGNRRGYELLHVPYGENISKSAAEVHASNNAYQFMRNGKPIPPDELPMQVAAATGMPARDFLMDLVFEDGATHQLIGNVNPLFDADGLPAGAIGAFVDVTRQLQLEKQQMEFRTQMEIHHRLMDQREKDRQSIARDIHDGPVQTLSSTLFNIQFAKEVVADPEFRIEMEQIAFNVRNAVQELRQVIFELRPPSVIRFGLARAIRYHAEDLREKYPELQIALNLADDQNQLSDLTCLTLYRIYQEAITNVTRHSGATRAWVRFKINKEHLVLEIGDNGKGFSVEENFGSLTEQGHFGLAGMRERAEVVNGKLAVTAEPGKGTVIQVKAPVAKRGMQVKG